MQQAIEEARQQRSRVRRSGLPLDESQRLVDVEVMPLSDPGGPLILVVFQDSRAPGAAIGAAALPSPAQEGSAHVLKHAEGASARVTLRRSDEQLSISVADQGVGFEPAPSRQLSEASGFGLFSVREQLARLGGTLTIDTAPCQGTRVRLQLPLMGPRRPALGDLGSTSVSRPKR